MHENYILELHRPYQQFMLNFIEYCEAEYEKFHGMEIQTINDWRWQLMINYYLKKFGGKLIMPRTYNAYLRFPSEEQALFFVMKYL